MPYQPSEHKNTAPNHPKIIAQGLRPSQLGYGLSGDVTNTSVRLQFTQPLPKMQCTSLSTPCPTPSPPAPAPPSLPATSEQLSGCIECLHCLHYSSSQPPLAHVRSESLCTIIPIPTIPASPCPISPACILLNDCVRRIKRSSS